MNIWIDGDSCPRQVKQILFRAAEKRKVAVLIVANHVAIIPSSRFIKRVLVESGFDKADTYIIDHLIKHDLVITGDILLAEVVLEKEASALSSRGLLYTRDNIKQMVATRNINESLRSSGLIQGGHSQLQQKEIVLFANHLDRIITQFHRE
jgi:uncharacterized protein